MQTPIFLPNNRSGTGKAQTSLELPASSLERNSPISGQETIPPLLMSDRSRPTMYKFPLASIFPMSPVLNHVPATTSAISSGRLNSPASSTGYGPKHAQLHRPHNMQATPQRVTPIRHPCPQGWQRSRLRDRQAHQQGCSTGPEAPPAIQLPVSSVDIPHVLTADQPFTLAPQARAERLTPSRCGFAESVHSRAWAKRAGQFASRRHRTHERNVAVIPMIFPSLEKTPMSAFFARTTSCPFISGNSRYKSIRDRSLSAGSKGSSDTSPGNLVG